MGIILLHRYDDQFATVRVLTNRTPSYPSWLLNKAELVLGITHRAGIRLRLRGRFISCRLGVLKPGKLLLKGNVLLTGAGYMDSLDLTNVPERCASVTGYLFNELDLEETILTDGLALERDVEIVYHN